MDDHDPTARPGTRRGLRIAFRVLLALGLLLAGALAVAVLVIDQEDYRDALVRLVEKNTDYRLAIDGPFGLALSLAPTIRAGDVTVAPKTGDARLEITEVRLQFELLSLLSGEPVVTVLGFDGIDLDAATLDAWRASRPQTAPSKPPALPSLPRIELANIRLQPDADAPAVEILRAEIAAPRPNAPIRATARFAVGSIDATLDAEFGAPRELLRPTTPYPVAIELRTGNGRLALAGTVAEPTAGRGIALDVDGGTDDLAQALAHFGYTTPALGALRIEGRLAGDAGDLLLSDLAAAISGREGFTLEASAPSVRLLPFEPVELAVTGTLDDPALREALLPEWLGPATTWQIAGTLVVAADSIGYRDTRATGTLADRFQVEGHGSATFALGPDEAWPPQAFDLALDIKSKTSNALQALLPDFLPELGPVSATGRLTGTADGLALDGLDLVAGQGSNLAVRARGGIATLPTGGGVAIAGIDLALDVDAAKTERVGYLFGTELVELGPVRLAGRYRGGADGAVINGLEVTAGHADRLTVEAGGQLRFGPYADASPVTRINVDTRVAAPSTAALAAIVGTELPAHGPFRGRFVLAGDGKQQRLDDVELAVGPEDGVRVTARGSVGRLELDPALAASGVQLDVAASAPSTADLAPWLDFTPLDFGAVHARARLVDGDGSLGLEQGEVRVGPENKPLLVATGEVDDLVNRRQVAIDVRVDLDTDETLERLTGRSLTELGELHGEFEISDADGTLGIEDVEVTTTDTDLLSLKVTGLIDDFSAYDQLDFRAELATRDVAVLALLTGREWPSGSPVKAQGRVSGQPGRGRFEGTFEAGQTRIDMELDGDLSGVRPRLTGRIATEALHLVDFGLVAPDADATPAEAEPGKTAPRETASGEPDTPTAPVFTDPRPDGTQDQRPTGSSAGDPLIGNEPLPFEGLQAVDLALDVTVGDVIGTDAKLESLSAPVAIKDGQLTITPAVLLYENGQLTIDLLIDSNDTPRIGLVARGDDVALGTALAHTIGALPVSGNLNANVDLSASGTTPAELAASLDGLVELAIEDARVPRRMLELLTIDLLKWTVSGVLQPEAEGRLDCGIVRAQVEAGKFNFDHFYIDGPTITILGEGNLDLANERIDLSLYPRRKRRFWRNVTPVNISGPLTNPTVSALPASASAALYASFSLAPHLFLPTQAVGFLWDLVAEGTSQGEPGSCLEDLRGE